MVDLPFPVWAERQPGEALDETRHRRAEYNGSVDEWWANSAHGRRVAAEFDERRRVWNAESARPDGWWVTVFAWSVLRRQACCAYCAETLPAGSVVFRSAAGEERCTTCLSPAWPWPGAPGPADWVADFEAMPAGSDPRVAGIVELLRDRAGGRSDPRERCRTCRYGRVEPGDGPGRCRACRGARRAS